MDYRPKIKLSQDEFRVLASSTRIDILKLLDESQLTVSDVSRRLEMNKATVHEHLTKLMEVGLVKKEESPRKWVYYRLTWKGRNLLHPERVKVMVTLGIVALALVIGGLLATASIPLELSDNGQTPTEELPTGPPGARMYWGEVELGGSVLVTPSAFDLVYESTGTPTTMASVKELDSYIESGPTTISRNRRVDLSWAMEGDTIHLYDYGKVLESHGGEYLYVEGTIIDNMGYDHPFSLRRYLVPAMTVDLRISRVGIIIDTSNLSTTGLVNINFSVENVGPFDVESILVEVYSVRPTFRASGFPSYGSPYLSHLYNETISIQTNGFENISFSLSARQLYTRGLMAFIDPANSVPELPTDNNQITTGLPEEIVEMNEETTPGDGSKEEESPGFGALVATMALVVVLLVVRTYKKG